MELEAHGGHGPSDLLKDELSQSLEELEALLKAKDEVGAHWQLEPEADRSFILSLVFISGVERPKCLLYTSMYIILGNPHFAKQESRVSPDGARQGPGHPQITGKTLDSCDGEACSCCCPEWFQVAVSSC